MKRYLLFVFEEHYPCGGFNDYRQDFASLEFIAEYLRGEKFKASISDPMYILPSDYDIRIQVFDLEAGKVVIGDIEYRNILQHIESIEENGLSIDELLIDDINSLYKPPLKD